MQKNRAAALEIKHQRQKIEQAAQTKADEATAQKLHAELNGSAKEVDAAKATAQTKADEAIAQKLHAELNSSASGSSDISLVGGQPAAAFGGVAFGSQPTPPSAAAINGWTLVAKNTHVSVQVATRIFLTVLGATPSVTAASVAAAGVVDPQALRLAPLLRVHFVISLATQSINALIGFRMATQTNP